MPDQLIKHLEWDTTFFNFRVGRLLAQNREDFDLGLSIALERQFRLLYWEIETETTFSKRAKSTVQTFVGDQIRYRLNLARTVDIPTSATHVITPYEYQNADEELIALSISAGHSSRFNLDQRIEESQFERLYRAWTQNSCQRRVADTTLVAKTRSGETIGFITAKTSTRTAAIGLIAVAAKYRGLGIGRSLIESIKNEAVNQHCDSLEVATQLDNVAANWLYQRLGFKTKSITSFFHLWL